MHFSKYTFRFSVDDGKQVLLYNPLTNAMDIVEKQSLDLLDSIFDNGDKESIAKESISYLLKRGYAYRTPADEEAILQRRFEEFKERERKSNLRFVIIPTYQCNSRCSYCFIGDAIGQENLMDDETMDRAFAAMDVLAEERGRGCTRQLSLFGGEPLIDTPAQRRVVERILSNGAKRGFLIDVVSNGFDLSRYVDLLKQYAVSKVQVTFDGMRDYHNQRRRAIDGRGESFDRIVAGVETALARGLPTNVRILLDRNSIWSLPQLVTFFKEKQWFEDPNFTVHLGSVFDCFRCHPEKETANHLTMQEGNKALYQICTKDRSIADLLSIDWQGVRRFVCTGKLFPPTYKTCFGGTRTFAFDLNGGIYACETTAGKPEYRIGTFSPELALNHNLIKAMEERNIFTIPGCKECPQALLCAGGCTFNAYVTHGSLLAPGCRLLKETLQYGMDYYWPEIKERIELQPGSRPATGDGEDNNCCPPSSEYVRSFYAAAAQTPHSSLCCPTRYDPELISHIPQDVLAVSYGCGSPVMEAKILPGDVVLDLGCGAGIDTFLAARFVGASGRVIGVDMTDEMIDHAREHARTVAERLGYDVVEFRLGCIEEVPVADSVADVVISNCALNLSIHKQRAFDEIIRVLKPGGRFVISDVVADKPIPEDLRRNPDLWNQCIAGALSLNEFVTYARDAGFAGVNITLEDSWQEIDGIRFYTAILQGYKTEKSGRCIYRGQQAVYKGPFSSVTDDEGHTYPRGLPVEICTDTADGLRREPYAGMFLIIEQEGLKGAPCCSGKDAECSS